MRVFTSATVACAVLVLFSGCFTFSYASQSLPEPPKITEIEPPEIDPVQPKPDYTGLNESERIAVQIYHDLNRGVVNVTTVSLGYTWLSQAYPQSGSGSGAIIDQKGHILTNYHVIKGASQIAVTLYDGSRYLAKIVGIDPENDLALLSFNPDGRELTTVTLGTSKGLQVGQMVLALGNPFGLERTLTTGIISGLHRPLQNEDGYLLTDLIQTDASINPGNSGGPLLNSNGSIIGINTMIISPSQGSVGIGFAVPVDTAVRIIPDLKTHGRVIRGWIDITPIPVFPSLAARANLPVNYGVLVSETDPSGNAAAAGLKGGKNSSFITVGSMTIYLGGDIIINIAGKKVLSYQDYFSALEPTEPGDTVTVEFLRNGEPMSLDVVLSERPFRNPVGESR
jgi:S1-C subfamily serine protease